LMIFAASPCCGMEFCPAPHTAGPQECFRYGFPSTVKRDGLKFADVVVPIERPDVSSRILKEVNHLLQDRRSLVMLWLSRAESLKSIILPILKAHETPPEFIFLAAIESDFNSRSLSSAGAYGYWQFITSTAKCGLKGSDQYNWQMQITPWKDERADLKTSTNSAAKYLSWMNRVKKVKIGEKERDGFQNWLLAAAAYNAGPTKVLQQMNNFNVDSYWDVPLPMETERYVPRIIALSLIYKYKDFYNFRMPVKKQLAFETVDKLALQKDLTLGAMAKLLEVSPREIWSLNTQISPEKAVFPARVGRKSILHTVNIPRGTKKKLMSQLAANGYIRKP
jgi:hypothetical protein